MKSLSAIPRQPRLGAAHKSFRPALTVSPKPATAAAVNPSATVKHYDAARQDRLTGDFQISRLSGDAELQGRLPIIRARSRNAERNEPLAENFLLLSENNIVGHAGFNFESKVVLSEEVDEASGEVVVTYDARINREIERAWGVFRQRENFLTTRNMDAVAAEKLIVRTMRRDGDCLIRKVRGYPNRFGFALQLLEPDFLDDQYIEFRGVPCNCPNELTLPNGRPFPYCERGLHQVRMGVELHGDWMFPVAYHLLADHPGDYFFGNQFSVRRTRVLVEDIIHPLEFKRMGSTRGVPKLVAALLRLEMLGGYDEATLVKARAAAQKLGFLEKEIPDSIADQFADKLGDPSGTMDSEPGGILDLPPGVTFKPWDPADPSPQYEPFTKQQTRMVGCAGGVSYTSLSNNIEAVNFSSIRAGLLEERENWKGGQGHFIVEIERPIFEAWLPMAILSGECDVPMSRVEEFTRHDVAIFTGRSWEWVNPVDEVNAALLAIEGGIATRTDVIAGKGGDFEKTTSTLGREKKVREVAGILPPAPGSPPEEDDENEDDKPEDGADAAVKTFAYTDPDGVHFDIAVKRDGWVTINGAAVHLGDDGLVDKGPARLVRHFGRKEAGPDGAKPPGALGKVGDRELRAADFVHSRRADANGQAMHFMPASRLTTAWSKDSMHIPVGGGGAEQPGKRAGVKEFIAQGKPIPVGELHVDSDGVASFMDGRHRTAVLRDAGLTHIPVTMSGTSRANAEKHGLFTAVSNDPSRTVAVGDIRPGDRIDTPNPLGGSNLRGTVTGSSARDAATAPADAATPAKKRTPRSFSLPFAPTGAMDAIDHIADQGGIASRKLAEKRGSLAGYKADYDDAPELRGVYHHAVFGGSMRPDQMASILHESHGIGDGSVGGMYSAVSDAINTRQSVQKETARQKQVHQQGERFDRDALVHHKGDKTVNVSNLSEGDVLSIHGEKVRVKKVDADTGEVTLQDHTKYGVQRVSDGQALYVEHVEQKEDDGPF